MNTSYTISAQNLCKTFTAPDGKPFNAVNDIGLQVEKGRLTALVGRTARAKPR